MSMEVFLLDSRSQGLKLFICVKDGKVWYTYLAKLWSFILLSLDLALKASSRH